MVFGGLSKVGIRIYRILEFAEFEHMKLY